MRTEASPPKPQSHSAEARTDPEVIAKSSQESRLQGNITVLEQVTDHTVKAEVGISGHRIKQLIKIWLKVFHDQVGVGLS